MCLAGFGALISNESCGISVKESRGCKDAYISELYLTLAFPDRIESWDLQTKEKSASWSMEVKTESSGNVYPNLLWQLLEVGCDNWLNRKLTAAFPGPPMNLPLVPGGYIATKPPFYRSLSPHLKAKSLALSAEHAILLSASGAVYTWGLGRYTSYSHVACLYWES